MLLYQAAAVCLQVCCRLTALPQQKTSVQYSGCKRCYLAKLVTLEEAQVFVERQGL